MKKLVCTLFVSVFLFGGVAAAEEEKGSAEERLAAALASKIEKVNGIGEKQAEPKLFERGSYHQFGAVSIVLAALAFGAALLIRKGRRKGWLEAGSQDLAVQESVWIGKGQRLLLVAVGGQNVLVGATPQGLYGLGAFSGSGPKIEAPPAPSAPVEEEDPDEIFASMVKNEIARNSGGRRDRRKAYEELRAL